MFGSRIASKLRWFTLVIIGFTSMSVGLLGYLGNHAIIRDLQAEALKKRAAMEVGRLNLAFSELNRDIVFIQNLPMVAHLANNYDLRSDDSASDKLELAQVFEQMLKAKPDYALIRLIGASQNGRELVRVDQTADRIVRVAEENLQSKGDRDYFRQTQGGAPDEIYYSTIDLNREHGRIEMPIRPTLRVALPVYSDANVFFGIVIINLNFQSYMDTVLGSNARRQRHQYYLANEDGYYLFHPDKSYTFGFDLGFDLTAEDEFPELAGFFENAQTSITFRKGAMVDTVGTLVHFEKFKVFGPHRSLALGVAASYEDIGRASATLVAEIALAIGAVILLASIFAYRFSARMTMPLERIALAARSMTEDSYVGHYDLPLDRNDEIGDLANTFKAMKEAIERQRSELVNANQELYEVNQDLEHFAHISSHELREPIQRINGLAALYQSECSHGQTEDSQQILEQLNKECHRALLQIADFRDFSRITKDSSLLREETSMREVLLSVLDEFADRLKQRNVQVHLEDLPTIKVYPNLVRVLYVHLVENALLHVKKDGFTLAFTVEKNELNTYVFGVRNTGSGIDSDNVKSVFDIFSKLEKMSDGSGVGLAICKRIVDRHAGAIWVDSDRDFVHIKFVLDSE